MKCVKCGKFLEENEGVCHPLPMKYFRENDEVCLSCYLNEMSYRCWDGSIVCFEMSDYLIFLFLEILFFSAIVMILWIFPNDFLLGGFVFFWIVAMYRLCRYLECFYF